GWPGAHCMEALFHFIGNGLDLARVGPGANNKIVGERSGAPVHLQNGQLFTFFIFHCPHRLGHLLLGLYTHPRYCSWWRTRRKDSTLLPFLAPCFSRFAPFPRYRSSFLMYSATSRGTWLPSCFADLWAAARICVDDTRSFTLSSK